MKNILFMVLSFSIFLLFSCSDKEENEPFIPVDEIISAKTFLIPNKDTKVVSTILNFKNIDAIDYLMVRKSGGNSYSVKIDRNELTADYVFNYVVQKTDPQNFRLILVAVYKDGILTEYTAPCGVCRQVMMEFCDPETFRIILAIDKEHYDIYTLKDLLPLGFGLRNLINSREI